MEALLAQRFHFQAFLILRISIKGFKLIQWDEFGIDDP